MGIRAKTQSRRFRPKRLKAPPYRSLKREALEKIRKTETEEEYRLLVAESWRQLRELAQTMGRQGIDPNG
ncbi:MAG TPA: hypothetical protein VFC23_21600 [Thermoanaerobaculia bacterium]|nr:hypothetical protein [Thermoanaerobaculia bacterium]